MESSQPSPDKDEEPETLGLASCTCRIRAGRVWLLSKKATLLSQLCGLEAARSPLLPWSGARTSHCIRWRGHTAYGRILDSLEFVNGTDPHPLNSKL